MNDPKIRLYAAIAFATWFWLVYWLCDHIAYSLDTKYDVKIWFDGLVPFVPAFSVFYMLINPLFLLPIFASPDTSKFLAICFVLAISVLMAGVMFIVFPVFPIETPATHQNPVLHLSDWVNLRHNMVPSLHVTLSMIIGMTCSPLLAKGQKILLWAIVILIVLSTMLTKQHYIADVIAGVILSVVCVRLFLNPAHKLLARKLGKQI